MRLKKEELNKLTIRTAHEALTRGDFSAVDLAESYLAQIKEKNGELNVYLEVFADVREQAAEADRRLRKNDRVTLLTGIPLAVKDNILIEGRKCSSASKMLENYTAVYDATVIKRLKEQGAIFLGRTNMDEFTMGNSTENSAFGLTKNPYDNSRVSDGSAVAVGADMALAALGSDSGGSVCQASGFCGTVGLRPTRGAVSGYGVMAVSSFDQVGLIAKTSEDADILLKALQGVDSFDSNTYELPDCPTISAKPKLGVPHSFLKDNGVTQEVMDSFNRLVTKLKQDGYEVEEVEMPNWHYAPACHYVLMSAEASASLARFDGVRYGLHLDGRDVSDDYYKTRAAGFGHEVKRRIIFGTYILSADQYDVYYDKANQVRELIKQDYLNAFKQYDMVIMPTAPSPAFLAGQNTDDPLSVYLRDTFSVPANLAGLPAMNMSIGFTTVLETAPKGLPLGVQAVAPKHRENLLFSLGQTIEKLVQDKV